MRIAVKLFATLKDRVKAGQVMVELADGATVAALKEKLAADYPVLADALASCVVAVNQAFAFAEMPLHAGDEIALFPPVSGGEFPTIARVMSDPLDVNQIVRELTLATTGAVVTFTGAVRGSEGVKHVTQLF
jgi:molybdopterin converting factor subunit 1